MVKNEDFKVIKGKDKLKLYHHITQKLPIITFVLIVEFINSS